jgi:polyisoprenoid-binding protein YceI
MSAKKAYREINPEQLQQRLEEDDTVNLIHVMPVEVFRLRHIPGSKNACVYEVTFPDQVQSIASDKDSPIVLYGTSSNMHEATAAAEKLDRMAYRDILVLTGGMAGWQACGYDLTGEAPEAPLDPATTIDLADGRYPVDLNASAIEWSGRNPNGKHWGTIKMSSGTIAVNNGNLGGEFEIDMTAIKNIDLEGDELQPVLISHLESDDFFFTRLFPKARFVILGSEAINDRSRSGPNFRIAGNLELRGISAEIEFPATLSLTADDKILAEAHFDIDRTRWNILYGSSRFFEHLGMHLVYDPISVQLFIVTI